MRRSKRSEASPQRRDDKSSSRDQHTRYTASPLKERNAPSPARDMGNRPRKYGTYSAGSDSPRSMRSNRFYASLPRIRYGPSPSPARELEPRARRLQTPSRQAYETSQASNPYGLLVDAAFINSSDPSPTRETGRRRHEASPMREIQRGPTYGNENVRNVPPSPRISRPPVSRIQINEIPPSPRLQARGRALVRSYEPSASPRIIRRTGYYSASPARIPGRVSEKEYLVKVREILLGEPLKGNLQKPAQLLPHMYIGSQANAESLKLLRSLRITHVLNCAGYKGPRKDPNANPYEGLGIDYHEFKADDTEAYDITKHFDESFTFLDKVKRNKGICLVHCALGINRSGATCVAYLLVHQRWPLLKALDYIKQKRGVVLSNPSFQRQLIHFAHSQELLEPIAASYTSSYTPQRERDSVKSMYQARYGHWTDALKYLKNEPKEIEIPVKKDVTLSKGLGAAIEFRFNRFMNRDRV